MKIQKLRDDVIMPTKGSAHSAAFDIYMPEPGVATGWPRKWPLGFATAIPNGYVALMLPRSSTGSKSGLELNNTCGVIDSDYRGEWAAVIRTKDGLEYSWKRDDRLLQFLIVPVAILTLEEVDSLDETERGTGGFGSSGK